MKTALFALGLGVTAVLAGCRGQTSRESPVVGIRNMYDQPRYDMQQQSAFFEDKRNMRPLVEGVVAHDQEIDSRIAEGVLEDNSGYVLTLPQEVVDRNGGMSAVLKRGQERYGIYCAMCHGEAGSGHGIVRVRAEAANVAGFVPANLHDERLLHVPDGQLFATISHGKGNMAPYSHSVPVDDRWAIVAYVRALQLANPKLAQAEPAAEEPAKGAQAPAKNGAEEPAKDPAAGEPAKTTAEEPAKNPTAEQPAKNPTAEEPAKNP